MCRVMMPVKRRCEHSPLGCGVGTPSIIDEAMARARKIIDTGDPVSARRADLRNQIAKADRRIANIGDAIELGAGDMKELVRRLKAADAAQTELTKQLADLDQRPQSPRIDWREAERQARRVLDGWRGLMRRDVVAEGRQFFKQALEVPIRFIPFEKNGQRGYRFEGKLAIGQLFEGIVEVIGMASPPSNNRFSLPEVRRSLRDVA